jgi:hypothetical protein
VPQEPGDKDGIQADALLLCRPGGNRMPHLVWSTTWLRSPGRSCQIPENASFRVRSVRVPGAHPPPMPMHPYAMRCVFISV